MNSNEVEINIRYPYILSSLLVMVLLTNSLFGILEPRALRQSDFMSMFMGLGALLIALISFANFYLSIVIFIFATPLAALFIPGLPFFFTPVDAFIIVMVAFFLMRLSTGKVQRVNATFLDRTIFFFIIWSLLSMIKSYSVSVGFKEMIQSLEYFIAIYYIISLSLTKRDHLTTILHSILLISAIISIDGIGEYISMGGGSYRVKGTFGHFNAMGTFLAMTTTLAFVSATSERDTKRKILFFVILSLNIFSLLLTFSRGAWIGTIISIIITSQIKGMFNFVKYFSAIFVFLVVFSLFVPTSRYTERFKSISYISDPASESRLIQYSMAYESIIENPLLGVGIGNNQYHIAEKYDDPANAEIHNLFLYIGMERGIPAMLLLMWIFASYFRKTIGRMNKTEDDFYKTIYLALIGSMIAFVVANLFAFMLLRGPAYLFAIILGLLPATMYTEDNEPKDLSWARLLSSVDMKRPTMRMGR